MLRNYLKIAFKVFLRRKFFTFISLFGISLTLVVLVVAVALFDHVFGPQGPEADADRLLSVYFVHATGPKGDTKGPAGYAFLDRYVRTLKAPGKVTLHSVFFPVINYRNGTEIKSWVKNVDGEFWQVFHFDFLEGGPFSPDDEMSGNRVAVVNRTTADRFFGSAYAVGQTLSLEGQNFQVVGVVSDVPLLRLTVFSDVWVPLSTRKSQQLKKEFENGMCFATLLARDPGDLAGIREEFQTMLPRVEFPDPASFNRIQGEPQTLFNAVSAEIFSGYLRTAVTIAILLFLALPTLNLININVSRIGERASEIGVRKAFGASSLTIAGQFVVENVLLTVTGGLVAFVASQVVLYWINQSGWIPYADLAVNHRIFLYGFVIAVVFGLISGVYPAWRMSRLHPVEALRGRTL